MKSKYPFTYFGVLVAFIISTNLKAQTREDLVNLNTVLTNQINNSYNTFFEGSLILNNGDTLRGRFVSFPLNRTV